MEGYRRIPDSSSTWIGKLDYDKIEDVLLYDSNLMNFIIYKYVYKFDVLILKKVIINDQKTLKIKDNILKFIMKFKSTIIIIIWNLLTCFIKK
jgi:hypothetical protein